MPSDALLQIGYQYNLFMGNNIFAGDLSKYIETSESYIAENLVRSILHQLVLALQFVHDNKIMHRDIKPANVMVEQENGQGMIKVVLIDFGHSKMIEKTTKQSSIGTLNFMAPYG